MLGAMPRYFFTVIHSDQEELWDRKGTQVRDDATAIEVARDALAGRDPESDSHPNRFRGRQ